jgi:hypothetical protein
LFKHFEIFFCRKVISHIRWAENHVFSREENVILLTISHSRIILSPIHAEVCGDIPDLFVPSAHTDRMQTDEMFNQMLDFAKELFKAPGPNIGRII